MICSRLAIACLLIAPSLNAFAESPVPKVLGMPYDAARAAVIKAGWRPVTNMKLDDGDYYARDFRKDNGFTEVESCSGGGLLRCAFRFTDSKSHANLRLVTGGEGMPRVDDVQVQREVSSSSNKPAQKPKADVIGNHFTKTLPEMSRQLVEKTTLSFAKYIYFVMKNKPDEEAVVVNKFCYTQMLEIDESRKSMEAVTLTSGAAAANQQVRQMLQLADMERNDFIAKGKVEEALLLDVKVSSMMLAGYSRISGTRLTSIVGDACSNARDHAKEEVLKPESVLAFSADR